MFSNTGSGGIDTFEVKLTFDFSTVHGQQHSFSTHERMLFWKCQSFWNRYSLDLRGTRIPNGLTDISNLSTAEFKLCIQDPVKHILPKGSITSCAVYRHVQSIPLYMIWVLKYFELTCCCTSSYQYRIWNTSNNRAICALYQWHLYMVQIMEFAAVLLHSLQSRDLTHIILPKPSVRTTIHTYGAYVMCLLRGLQAGVIVGNFFNKCIFRFPYHHVLLLRSHPHVCDVHMGQISGSI